MPVTAPQAPASFRFAPTDIGRGVLAHRPRQRLKQGEGASPRAVAGRRSRVTLSSGPYGSRTVIVCTTYSRGSTGTIVIGLPISTLCGTSDWEVIV